MRSLVKQLRRYLVAGLLVWIPLGVTILLIGFAVRQMDKTIELLPRAYRPAEMLQQVFGTENPVHIPGFGVILILVVVLLSAWLVKLAWNVLARDFSALPGIGYRMALAIFCVSGLFLFEVLTMISGARELMTPEAWEKTGTTYRLKEPVETVEKRAG